MNIDDLFTQHKWRAANGIWWRLGPLADREYNGARRPSRWYFPLPRDPLQQCHGLRSQLELIERYVPAIQPPNCNTYYNYVISFCSCHQHSIIYVIISILLVYVLCYQLRLYKERIIIVYADLSWFLETRNVDRNS